MKTAEIIEPRQESVQAASPEQADPERRRSPRYETLIGAFIALERGHGDMRCHILNVSDTGALLRPFDVLLCPSQFTLKPEAGEQRKCEIVWTNGDMLAVRFVGEKVPPLTARDWAALGSEPTADLIEPRQSDNQRF
jgi:hypothetical protein